MIQKNYNPTLILDCVPVHAHDLVSIARYMCRLEATASPSEFVGQPYVDGNFRAERSRIVGVHPQEIPSSKIEELIFSLRVVVI